MEKHYDFCEVRAEYIMYISFIIQTAEFMCDMSNKQLHYFSKIYLENNQKADTLLGVQ
jgi:hypothetical protein